MLNCDVINIRGLFMDDEGDRISEILKSLPNPPRSVTTLAPTPRKAARELPQARLDQAVSEISKTLNDIEKEFGDVQAVLIGRSFGACVALMAAIRTHFEKILKIILIEGPLNPDSTVTPPLLIPPLRAFSAYYKERPHMARTTLAELQKEHASRIVIIQGGAEDAVVPTEAQVFPGDFERVSYQTYMQNHGSTSRGNGLIVQLDAHLKGTQEGLQRLLPLSYCNHLFWSDPKFEAITSIMSREISNLSEEELPHSLRAS